ncbi:MAG: hypothetical protein M1830_002078 [Pleopsidium flavum]|nr:MAG: hypothetical protein M1830_002078 [Pleopsidium flavum]
MTKPTLKSKPKSKPRDVVSTCAIFKHKKPAVLATNTSDGNTRRTIKDNTLGHKQNKVTYAKTSKRKRHDEDPQSVAFSDAIGVSRGDIQSMKDTSLNLAQDSLSEHLGTVSAKSDAIIEAAVTTKRTIFKPLRTEQLALSTMVDAKKVTETVLLGKRMEDFRKLVNTKEKELKSLWKQWTAVQQEIIQLGMDVLGPHVFQGVATADGKNTAVKSRSMSEFAKEEEKLAKEFEGEKKKLEDEIKNISKEAVQKMEASEKEFDVLQRKQRRDLLSFMSAQI